MLQANRLKVTEGQLATIAGQAAGKKVRCSPQALPVYNQLVALAAQGNHWARLIVQGIRGLTAGRLHMDNVYIKQEAAIAYGRGVFYIVLPGVRATVEDCADGSFVLQSLQADLGYLQGQEEFRKPGLWRVKYSEGDNDPVFQKDGMVLRKDYRAVVIADSASQAPRYVARFIYEDLLKTDSTLKMMAESSGFDMHYTPGKGLVGLKNAKKAIGTDKDKALVESAILLANTMHKAHSIPGVTWFADWGGSAILTRALQILTHEKSVKFESHRIVLNRPTSSSSVAFKLARDLNISITEKRTGLTPKEIMGNHLHSDVSSKAVGKASVLGLSAAGAAFSMAGVALTIAGGVGFAGALYFVGTTMVAGTKALSPKKYK